MNQKLEATEVLSCFLLGLGLFSAAGDAVQRGKIVYRQEAPAVSR